MPRQEGACTHGDDEAEAEDRRTNESAADADRFFWDQALQIGPILDLLRHHTHEDAVVVPQARRRHQGWRGFGLGCLVEDVAQLVALVAGFGEEACEVGGGEVSLSEELEEFPDLRGRTSDSWE